LTIYQPLAHIWAAEDFEDIDAAEVFLAITEGTPPHGYNHGGGMWNWDTHSRRANALSPSVPMKNIFIARTEYYPSWAEFLAAEAASSVRVEVSA
jgi:hypothetical protein